MISGTEQPRELADAIPLVERAFAFMDLCGFTKFIATNGEHAAIEALTSFRSLTRELATRRGEQRERERVVVGIEGADRVEIADPHGR